MVHRPICERLVMSASSEDRTLFLLVWLCRDRFSPRYNPKVNQAAGGKLGSEPHTPVK